MERNIHLSIYGRIEFGPADDLAWDLLQTRPLARLRDVSLDSVPSRFVPHSVAVTRGQHSVAVAHLARLLAEREPELRPHRQTLIAASLLHDSGSPPFSHIAEPFLYGLSGRTHEQQTETLLAPGGEIAELLCRYDVDPAEVLSFITGQHPWPLIAGSLDLDNVDNSIHLLVSLGEQNRFYDPVRLVRSLRIEDGELCIDTSEIRQLIGWRDAREALYALLYDGPHVSSMATLHRAIEYALAADAIGEGFFSLDESEALTILRRQATGETASLVDTLINWRHFPALFQQINEDEDDRLLCLYDDWRARKQFTDSVAEELDVPGHELAFHVGRMRGPKRIELPFVGPDADAAAVMFAGGESRQQISLFVHKRHLDRLRTADVAAIVDELAESLPRVTHSHSFC